jgi:activator of 2-hydroxyglutaryl-CoA dehydratase
MLADTLYERLQEQIKGMEGELKEGEELQVFYTRHGGEQLVITDIGYHNPSLMILYGVDEGSNECAVLVHMNSVELLLRVAKASVPQEPRRIGFIADRGGDAKDYS